MVTCEITAVMTCGEDRDVLVDARMSDVALAVVCEIAVVMMLGSP